jgi:hypothetical protein
MCEVRRKAWKNLGVFWVTSALLGSFTSEIRPRTRKAQTRMSAPTLSAYIASLHFSDPGAEGRNIHRT